MKRFRRLLISVLLLRSCVVWATDGLFFEVVPAAKGLQLVRLSLPLPNGFLSESQGLKLESPSDGFTSSRPPAIVPAVRPLSWHPATQASKRSVRRALVTFPYYFKDIRPVRFRGSSLGGSQPQPPAIPIALKYEHGKISLRWRNGDQADLRPIAPPQARAVIFKEEVVEENQFFIWKRWHLTDESWPLMIELRCDTLGTAVVVAHLQRGDPGGDFAPEFGWNVRLDSANVGVLRRDRGNQSLTEEALEHDFRSGEQVSLLVGLGKLAIYNPCASYKRCGGLLVKRLTEKTLDYCYYRSRSGDQLPMQHRAWRRAEVVLSPREVACLTPTLESPHAVRISADVWDELYSPIAQFRWSSENRHSVQEKGRKEELREVKDALKSVEAYHNDAILRCMAHGADWGNFTEYNDARDEGAAFGMNRLQHCPQVFLEGWRSNDVRLVRAAVLWCENHHDQSIWWGENGRGGSRYNNVSSLGKEPPTKDYMWRSAGASSFCTKGLDSFWLAWEQTGDPRMRSALSAQFEYLRKNLHADDGECRNVGVVRECLRLYRYSGKDVFRIEAERLFGELHTKVSGEGLFDQNGREITRDPPYIDQSCEVKAGYPKPYIIGHALAGLPDLLVLEPADERIRHVVEGVATFLVNTIDPVGGWRYPHANSSAIQLDLSIETAWQLVQAAYVLGPEDRFLDAIEQVLRQRILFHRRSAQVAAQLDGWEISTGFVKDIRELCVLYKSPRERDAEKDYTQGRVRLGYAAPEGLIYFNEVLRYYLAYRPGSTLFSPPPMNTPMASVLNRVPQARRR